MALLFFSKKATFGLFFVLFLFSNEKLWGGNIVSISTKEEFKTQRLILLP
jgi:hypothetical protein